MPWNRREHSTLFSRALTPDCFNVTCIPRDHIDLESNDTWPAGEEVNPN